MYTCIHVYTYTCIHVYMRTCIHAYMYTCIHTYKQPYIHAYIHTCIHSCIHTYIHTCMHTYMHAYMHACMYIRDICGYIFMEVYVYIRDTYVYIYSAIWNKSMNLSILLNPAWSQRDRERETERDRERERERERHSLQSDGARQSSSGAAHQRSSNTGGELHRLVDARFPAHKPCHEAHPPQSRRACGERVAPLRGRTGFRPSHGM